jgi:tetratricopeptide (TPR) repeat protein
MKCGFCDVESDLDSAFRLTRKSFSFQQVRPMCPSCWERHQADVSKWAFRVWMGASILSIVMSGVVGRPDARWRLLVLGCVLPFLYLAIVLHEFAHALAALALGLRLFGVSYGLSGRILYRRRFYKCTFEIRRSLPGGMTQAFPRSTRWIRLRWGLVVAAAPLANLLVAAVIFLELRQGSIWEALVAAFAWANVIAAASSLFPWKHQTHLGAVPSDGLVLLMLPFESAETSQRRHAAYFARESLTCLRTKDYARAADWAEQGQREYPGEIQTRCMLGLALISLKRCGEARNLFIELAASDKPPANLPQNKAILLNNAAWADLSAGDASRLEAADQFSQQAMRLTPWVRDIKGARGSVLVTLGRTEEGIPLLEEAMENNDENTNTAVYACYLSLGLKKEGNLVASRRLLEQARKLDPACELIPQVADELNQSSALKPPEASAGCHR